MFYDKVFIIILIVKIFQQLISFIE